MAGTLPGVEAARRRRFHHCASDNAASWIRKSSSSSSSSSLRSACYVHEHNKDDEKLGGAAREAKERLDEKLRSRRTQSLGHPGVAKQEDMMGLKTNGTSKRLGWKVKLVWNWKASEQEECSICLERFKLCEYLVHLRCAHKFHSKCLGTWIECNAHCPCCRLSVTS